MTKGDDVRSGTPFPSSCSSLRDASRPCLKPEHVHRHGSSADRIAAVAACLPDLRSTRILPPSFPLTVSSVLSRWTAVRCLALGLAVLTLVGCRGDRHPTSTQPLSDPPTSYP